MPADGGSFAERAAHPNVMRAPRGPVTIATVKEDAMARGRAGTAPATAPTPVVLRRLAACTLCAERFAATITRHSPRPIFQIDPRARVLVASQAPGNRAHQSGLPFDDPSGKRLRAWLGLEPERFYDPARLAIAPMAHCFPGYDAKGSDLPPPPICAATWHDALRAMLPEIRLTLVIGQYAQRRYLGPPPKGGVTQRVKALHGAIARGETPDVVALPHPSWRNTAWLKRNPWYEAEVLPWLQARVAALLA
ncbi:MAG: uracil-DNA glycosylase family protein [Pseudomonadota bacterium]